MTGSTGRPPDGDPGPAGDADRWALVGRLNSRPEATARLWVLPQAGAGAARSLEFARRMRSDVEVVPFRLPGRESRHREPPLSDPDAVARGLLAVTARRAGLPTWLLGSCSGALVVLDLAARLRQEGRPPAGLVLLSQPCPGPDTADRVFGELGSDALWDQLTAAGLAPAVGDDPEVRRVFEPVVRADLAIARGLWMRAEVPPGVRALVVRGDRDTVMTAADLDAWAQHPGVERATVRGGHLLLDGDPDDLAELAGVVGSFVAG